jgi:cytochrome c peroxidase
MNRMKKSWVGGLATLAVTAVACAATSTDGGRWSDEQIDEIRSLWIGELEPLPPDPTNRYADDPSAVALGKKLFFDARLSSTGEVSCATCHLPGRQFQDDRPLGEGVGTTNRRTMPIAGTAYSSWMFWDGRKDSQWSQALGPLESPVEHGGSRGLYARLIADHYAEEYELVFGALPNLSHVPRNAGPVADPTARAAWEAMAEADQEAVNRVFANLGKAIAAYERRLQPGPGRFDRYVELLIAEGREPEGVLSEDEIAGLGLFIGKANCTQCHNGPLLTDDFFHNTGVPAAVGLPDDAGRSAGARQVLEDEFNCRSRYSDARPEECSELEFLIPEGEELVRAFKAPSLRGVADRAPYMHAGQIATLEDAIDHYSRAPRAPAGTTELHPLKLSKRERAQLVAYLRTLSGAIDAPPELVLPPAPGDRG